ncbi:MAG: DUF4405 domain-containing protein [Thermodesulfobacteriota bacterium]
MSISIKRTTLNPVLVITGGICFISGVLMFFHVKSVVIVPTHEWASIVFLAACALHIVLNWKPLLLTLKGRPLHLSIMGILVLFLAGMLYSTTLPNPKRPYPGGPPVAHQTR